MSANPAKQRLAMPEFELFRALDVGREPLDQAAQIRSEARLEQILSEPQSGPAPRRLALPKPTPAWRWAAIPVAAAAAIGLGIALPGAPGAAPAYATLATWRAEPIAIPDDRLPLATESCLAAINEAVDGMNNAEYKADPNWVLESKIAAEPVVAELRGDWGFLVFADPDGDQGAGCFVWLPDSQTADVKYAQLSGLGFATSVGRQDDDQGTIVGGSFGGPMPLPFGVASPSAMTVMLNDDEYFAAIMAPVPDDIASLVVHGDAGDVTATISDGWYAAWWPTTTLGSDQPGGTTGFTATHADGTVAEISICWGGGSYGWDDGRMLCQVGTELRDPLTGEVVSVGVNETEFDETE